MQEFALGALLTRWGPVARHNLAASEAETLPLRDLLAMAAPDDLHRWQGLDLGYTDPRGAVWLRQAIAGTYAGITPDTVLCFAGAQEALACAARALLSAGDHAAPDHAPHGLAAQGHAAQGHAPRGHAIVVVPCYQPSEMAVTSVADVTGVALDPDDRWRLDLAKVAAAIRPTTRLVVVNFPNNPTGTLIDRGCLDALIALCRRHGLWLVNDEVYRLIDRDPAMRLPQIAEVYERGISINALTKSHGLPGLRVGWAACRDRGVLARMQAVKTALSGCLAAPSEVLAHIAIQAQGRILGRNRALADANLRRLRAFFARHSGLFEWDEPAGGVTAFPRYRGADGVEAFAEELAREAGVLVLPGSVWRSSLGPTPADRFRVGFGRNGVAPALDAWEGFIVGRQPAAARRVG
jgi:aspartate/methionine/tyrosine aminotransferase